MLSVPRGAALYVGALLGPGLLLIPALAYQLAGPASVLAWLAVLLLSAPVALVFGALAIQHPVAGGVAAYARAAFGDTVAAVTGIWFVTAVVIGGPAVVLVGAFYVAAATGTGRTTAVLVAAAMYAAVLVTNAFGLAVSSRVQLVLSTLLVVTVVVAVLIGLSHPDPEPWVPFAPHGWWAVGTATNVLLWLVIGWEAMAQLAGRFRQPRRDVPRAIGVAFAVIVVLYAGLAVASVVAPGPAGSAVPLADLIERGLGDVGRVATAVLAAVLTLGTVNVYTGSVVALVGALADDDALPRWVAGRSTDERPSARPLLALAATGAVLLIALAFQVIGTTELVRATSACFVAVYLAALLAAVRVLHGAMRAAAVVAVVLAAAVAAFSATYLLVPLVAAALVVVTRRARSRREPATT
ncbi:MAG TPA: amino acid permease [Candidatus Nanopelagicales bacterium]|nr:amino acid permease [Candidatus Nanopelagicales bacterium]